MKLAFETKIGRTTINPDASLTCEPATKAIHLVGSKTAIRHAFCEVLLNGLQASGPEAKLELRADFSAAPSSKASLTVEFRDNGGGFSEEAAAKATMPFFTTRTVGLGLGLTVVRKIIENHHGKLEIRPS